MGRRDSGKGGTLPGDRDKLLHSGCELDEVNRPTMNRMMDADLRQFVDWLIPLGKAYIEFLLYAIRGRDATPFTTPHLSLWPSGTEVSNYRLADESWPVVVELFEIRVPVFPEDYERVLSSPMTELIKQDAVLCWYMFDATFGDISNLFTRWQAERTFGILMPGDNPHIAISEACRQSEHWTSLLRNATEHIHRCYPQLENLYGHDEFDDVR